MNLSKWTILGFFFMSCYAQAVSTTSLTMMSADGIGELSIKNNSNVDMRYYIHAREISFPNEQYYEIKDKINSLGVSERYFVLSPRAKKMLKLTYRGDMSKERYYQLSIKEKPVCDSCNNDNSQPSLDDRKESKVLINTDIRPLVIVSPKSSHYSYKKQSGMIKNTGNSSILMMLDDVCTHKASRTWFLAPSDEFKLSKIKKNERLSIGMKERIVNVIENVCAAGH